MPQLEPLKPSAKRDKTKRHTSPPPGATPIRRIKLATRDPRHGFAGPKVKSPNKAYR